MEDNFNGHVKSMPFSLIIDVNATDFRPVPDKDPEDENDTDEKHRMP